MYEVEISFFNENYACILTDKFDFSIDVISANRIKDTTYGLLKTNLNPSELKNLRDEFLKFRYVKDLEVLNEGFAKIVIEESEKNLPIASTISRFKGFILTPVHFMGGNERLNMIFEERKDFLDFKNTVGINFKILKLKKMNPPYSEDLTKKQLEALHRALKDGYFDVPKRTSLLELSEKMKVSKTTFLEHLKKAEKKVLKKYFKT